MWLTCTCLLSLGLAQAPAPIEPSVAPARSAQRQIEAAVRALGGAALVDGVKTLRLTGTTRRRVGTGEMEMKVAIFYAYPDRYRQEMTLPVGAIVTIVNREAAVLLLEGQPMPLPEEERTALEKAMRRNLVALLQARRQPGYAPTLAGTGTVGTTPVDRVTVNVQGEPTTLAIARDTGRILQLSYGGPGPKGGNSEVVVTLSDFRRVDGLTYPFVLEATLDGQPAYSSKLDGVTVNPKLDEALFQAPAASTP